MTIKKKAKSIILEAVRETAADLHRLGFIDKRKMKQYEALCLEPIPAYDRKKRALRAHLQVSTLDTTNNGQIVLAKKRTYNLAELIGQCDPKAPPPADLTLWDSATPAGQEVW